MHEMSLCENILQLLQQQARQQNYSKVKKVWLEIGDLAGVEIDAMRFSFDLVMEKSLAEGAILEIINIPGKAKCLQCQKDVEVLQFYDECPLCGGYDLQIINGDQMRIKELEVE